MSGALQCADVPHRGQLSCAPAPSRCDVAIVGGGIVGLAVARELTRRHPRVSVCVLEREAELGTHQTGHNSGVVHAGVYYTPGSLKARLCVRGRARAVCLLRGAPIAVEACGKLIVATEPSELGRLEELERRAAANGVAGVRRIDARGIEALEPHARGIAGLHVPGTGIVDFAALARAYAHDVLDAGGEIATGCGVEACGPGRVAAHRARARGDRGGTRDRLRGRLVRSAGGDGGADPDPRIVPFRGAYLRLRPRAGASCAR